MTARQRLDNLIFSAIRTVIPAFIVWLTGVVTENFGPIISENTKVQVAALLYFVAFGIYYTVVRLIETYVAPKISFLLGDFRRGATPPAYPDESVAIVLPPTG